MRRSVIAVLLFFALSALSFAQSRGAINGRVTDPAGAVVVGANVTATNAGTGISRTTVTNSDGLYSFPQLDAGTYNIKVAAQGFAAATQQAITLVTDTILTRDFSLSVGSAQQEVVVTSEIPLVETTQSQVAGTLQTSEVQALPILNRNFSGMVTLVPGARPSQMTNSNKIGFGGGIAVGGGTGRNVELEVDGMASRDDVVGGTMFNVTLEGIQEFKVLSHDFSAQYGRTSGSVVIVGTKSGTNQFHGTAFAYGRNDAMTAVDYFSDPANKGLGNPPYDREQFGGSIGGPIIKDRLFFFGGAERVQENRVKPYPANAFTQATTLKQALTALTTCPMCVAVGNALQPSSNSPQTIRDLMLTVKGDYHINNRHSLFVRWNQQRLDSFNDLIVNSGAPPHPDTDPNGSNVFDVGRGWSIVGSETWVIGNASVNTFAIQGNHLLTSQTCKCGTPGPFWAWRNMQFPSMQVGVSQNATDQDFYQDTVQFKDDFSHIVGKHSLKFGGDFSFFPTIGVTLAGAGGVTQGETSFFDDPTTIVTNKVKYPQGFLTPGVMSQMVVGTVMLGGPAGAGKADTTGQKQVGLYFQDDWKIQPRLTLNLGLRYDLDINWYNQPEYASNRTYLALKAISSPYGALPQTPKRDFSPRVGFAWDVTGNGKNVVRAGFGIFFDQMMMINNFTSALQEKATLGNLASTLSNTAVNTGQLKGVVYGGTVPAGPLPGATQFRPGVSSNGAWLDPKITDPYNEQVHVGYTRQITGSSIVSADFTHILGLHDFRAIQINPIENPIWDPNAASYNTCGAPAPFRRLQCQFQSVLGDGKILGGITIPTSINRSQYNELTLHFEQRTRPVTLQGSYTLSYANGFGGAIYGATGGIGPTVPMIPFQPFGPGEWGPTLTDERHHAVISGVINLPWGVQASPIFQIGSARPYQPAAGADWTGAGQSAAGSQAAVRGWFNSSGQPVAPFTAGATVASVNSLRGTATWDLDSRFTKTINLWSESRKLALFVELYNITNKANFGNSYNNVVTSPTFAQPLSYLNNGLSLPTSRQLQLGGRFTF